MFQILGSLNPFAAHCNRRKVLEIGAASLGLPQLLCLEAQGAPQAISTSDGFGKARNVLLIYLQGAASQFETWDPKPEAPEGIRGKFGAISTAVAGTSICDQLPKLACLTDRMALVRSMTHPHNNHSNLYTLTGAPAIDFSNETNPFDSRHRPFFGSVLDYLADQAGAEDPTDVPRNMALPWQFSAFAPFSRRAGPYASFLGHGYNPVWTEFHGKATRTVPRVSFFHGLKDVDVADPYLGITPESRLKVSKEAQLRDGITLDRLNRRRSLVRQFDDQKAYLNDLSAGKGHDRFAAKAYSMITSARVRDALDVGLEPTSLRERYGMTLFGQSALTGRRLLEAGCRIVSVFWDEFEVVNTAWDTHFDHFTRLGDELLPSFDAAMSTLLLDLEERGLLDETLVMCLTEHGRTPKIDTHIRGGGRDHWSSVYSVMLAGAGIKPGCVVGASDATGAFVKERPVSPEDILSTMYHIKGIDLETTIPDLRQRPTRLIDNGSVIEELLG
ncbi:DUF1501 domain-containing protein [Schlesneria sp. T3-172]|uniref:DUF1501 domain-containing protein n=1 Tax=Schlesneria sphaerica TaxID=3373610 RepID=UPI0037CBC472